MIEVSGISSGRMSPTVVYPNIGTGGGSEAIWLSPDETLLYICNFWSNSVSAVLFDKATGAVTFGCTDTLRGIAFEAGIATVIQVGTGSTAYVANAENSINFATVRENAGSCSIEEDASSPASEANSLDSIAAFPPATF
jgi:sugar lactone lactonase YvrE